MSRALKQGAYCGANQATTNALVIAVDGVAVMANTANACSPDLAQTGRTFDYVNAAGTQHYTVGSSLDILRLVYGGTDSGGFHLGIDVDAADRRIGGECANLGGR